MFFHIYIQTEIMPYILQGKIRNRGSESSQIITVHRQRRAQIHDHVGGSNSAERIHDQTARLALDTENLALAVFRCGKRGACGAVVVEEAVQSRPVDDNIVAVEHTETQSVTVPRETAAVVRVVEGGVGRVWTVGRIGIGLVVSRRHYVSMRSHWRFIIPRASYGDSVWINPATTELAPEN